MEKRNWSPPDSASSQLLASARGNAWQEVASVAVSGDGQVLPSGDTLLFASRGVLAPDDTARIRILLLSANPGACSAHRTLGALGVATCMSGCCGTLAQDEEARAIERALNASVGASLFRLETKWAVRCSEVQEHLLRHRPQIVHLSGHGLEGEGIVLLDSRGEPKPVSAKALEGLFKTLRDNVRVVLLNACWSAASAHAVSRAVGCAIGMRGPISDLAAISFATAFYRGLGFGKTMRDAFELGRSELELQGFNEAHVPQFFG